VTKTAGELPRASSTGSGIKIVGLSAAAGETYGFPVVIDSVDTNKALKFEFAVKPVAGYTDGDFEVRVVDVASGELIVPRVTTVANAEYVFRTQWDSRAGTSYIPVLLGKSGLTTTPGVVISDVVVGPGTINATYSDRSALPAGSIAPYAGDVTTPPPGWLVCDGADKSPTEFPDLFAAIGTTYNTQINPTTGSAWAPPATAGNFRVPDYRGLFLRGVGVPVDLNAVALGGYYLDQFKEHRHLLSYSTSTGTGTRIARGTSDQVTQANSEATGDLETRPRNKGVNYIIKAWNASSVNVGQNDVEFIAHDGTSVVYGLGGSLVPDVAVGTAVDRSLIFADAQQQEDWQVEYRSGPNRPWVPVVGVLPYAAQGANEYGVRYFWNDATTLIVRFNVGGARSNGATYAANSGRSWSAERTSGATWRVRRIRGGSAVGFGHFQPGVSSGLVPAAGLPGVANNSNAPAGTVGEYIENRRSANINAATSGSYLTLASITLAPGDWDVTAEVLVNRNTANPATFTENIRFVIHEEPNSAAGITTTMRNWAAFFPSSLATGALTTGNISNYRVSIETTKTLYLNAYASYSAGQPTFLGGISARRVR
jgi:microcystin-dependent protein